MKMTSQQELLNNKKKANTENSYLNNFCILSTLKDTKTLTPDIFKTFQVVEALVYEKH